MRDTWFLPAMLLALAPFAAAQPQCPGPVSVNSYKVVPVANSFQSIRALPGVVPVHTAPADDLTSGPVPIPYPFEFFRVPFTDVYVDTNGYATLNPAAGTDWTNKHPGDGETPNNLVMPWHDDLIFTSTGCAAPGAVYAGLDANGIFTIEWQNAQTWVAASTGHACFSFQAKLYASTHPTLANAIEFHYDLANPPSPVSSCQTTTAGTSSYAVSATIGLEGEPSAVGGAAAGVDGTERGAGNEAFPPCGLRFVPAAFKASDEAAAGFYAVTTVSPAPPFCHIDNLAGSTGIVATGGPLAGWPNCPAPTSPPACMDDERSAYVLGDLIDLPWKFTMYGRTTKNVNLNSNGHVAFGPGYFPAAFSPVGLPTVGDPDLAAYPFWGDLEGIMPTDHGPSPLPPLPDTGLMWYRTDGLPGARVSTFEWHDQHAWATPGRNCAAGVPHATFQVKIFEGSAGSLASSAGTCPYDTVVPGVGADRIEFHYDAAGCTSGFVASTGIENATGTAAHGAAATFTCPSAAQVFTPCQGGLVSYYGDASNTPTPAGGLCLPEIKGNAVPPRLGNPFGVQVVGARPASPALLLLDYGGALAGLATPVPPGGLALPWGMLWVNPLTTTILSAGATSPGGPCEGCRALELLIPNDPTLLRALLFAQYAVLFPGCAGGPAGLCVEFTEGMRIRVGS